MTNDERTALVLKYFFWLDFDAGNDVAHFEEWLLNTLNRALKWKEGMIDSQDWPWPYE